MKTEDYSLLVKLDYCSSKTDTLLKKAEESIGWHIHSVMKISKIILPFEWVISLAIGNLFISWHPG